MAEQECESRLFPKPARSAMRVGVTCHLDWAAGVTAFPGESPRASLNEVSMCVSGFSGVAGPSHGGQASSSPLEPRGEEKGQVRETVLSLQASLWAGRWSPTFALGPRLEPACPLQISGLFTQPPASTSLGSAD